MMDLLRATAGRGGEKAGRLRDLRGREGGGLVKWARRRRERSI